MATNGLSLAANYVVPNTVIAQSLGRLPANALPTCTTTVGLLNPGVLYTLERINLVDMRFAKIFRFAGRRLDAGVDLLQSVQLQRHHELSADLRVSDERRGLADTHGHRRAAARAVPCDAELLIARKGGRPLLGPPYWP